MAEQRIKATERQRGTLARRIAQAVDALKQAKSAEEIAADLFESLCESNGLPAETEFVRIDGDEIVVNAPAKAG